MKKTAFILTFLLLITVIYPLHSSAERAERSNFGLKLAGSKMDIPISKVEPPVAPPPPPPVPPTPKDSSRVPILAYHEVGDPPTGSSQDIAYLYVSASSFAAQMKYLKDNSYTPMTLKEVQSHWEKGVPLPEKPVVLTFDDGYIGVYDNAFPAMREHGFVGVLFLITDRIGTPGYMSHEHIAEMTAHGFEIGGHTFSHLHLTKLTLEQRTFEILSNKAFLEEQFNVKVTSFCYPYGDYNTQVIDTVKNAGYSLAATVREGKATRNQPRFELLRHGVWRSDSIARFGQLVAP